MLADGHVLWKALKRLENDHASQMLRRFASLSEPREIELWRNSNDHGTRDEHSDKEIARSVAQEAGWSDLATYWSE